MHEVAGPVFLVWLETSGFAQAMRTWLWLYPGIEIAHIVGIVLLVGAVAMLDLRILGLSTNLPVRHMAAHVLPWSVAGFALVAVTGFMMFTAHATEFWTNPAFLVKLSLIALAGVNAFAFHRGAFRHVVGWDTRVSAPRAAKVSALASLVIWVGVIACGRLLAYL